MRASRRGSRPSTRPRTWRSMTSTAPAPSVTLRQGWRTAGDRLRLHRRLRRLSRRQPRQRASRRAARSTRRSIRSAGWAMLADVPPVSHELIYSNPSAASRSVRSERRRAAATTCSARCTRRSRSWSDDAVLGRIAPPHRPGVRRDAGHRSGAREEHRAAAQLRGRADALRPAVPGWRCRAHRPANRRQGTQPRRVRRRAICRVP